MSDSRRPWRPTRRLLPIRPHVRARAPHAIDPAARMRTAAAWPLDECLVSATWASGAPVTVVWIRRHPDQPRYAVALVRADLSGGGIERAAGLCDVGLAATWSAIETAQTHGALVRCDPALAAKLLYGAVERAPERSADPDWIWVSELLGPTDPARCAVPLPPPRRIGPEGPIADGRSLAEHLRRTDFAMFSPVAAADA